MSDASLLDAVRDTVASAAAVVSCVCMSVIMCVCSGAPIVTGDICSVCPDRASVGRHSFLVSLNLNFPEPKMTSSDVLICPTNSTKLKDV